MRSPWGLGPILFALASALLVAAGASVGHSVGLTMDIQREHGPVSGTVSTNVVGATDHRISVDYTDLQGAHRTGYDYVTDPSLFPAKAGDAVILLYKATSERRSDVVMLDPASISWHNEHARRARYFLIGGLLGVPIAVAAQLLVFRRWLHRAPEPRAYARISLRRE